jgi:hypothetical protein
MIANLSVSKRRFLSLQIKQKTIFVSILTAVSLALILLFPSMIKSLVKEIRHVRSVAEKQNLWFSRERQIEGSIDSFVKSYDYGVGKGNSVSGATIEEIAHGTGADYVIAEFPKGTLGQFSISRFGVTFSNITLPTLVAFFNKMEAAGNNVAISEAQIRARGNKTLNVACVVSILHVKRD